MEFGETLAPPVYSSRTLKKKHSVLAPCFNNISFLSLVIRFSHL